MAATKRYILCGCNAFTPSLSINGEAKFSKTAYVAMQSNKRQGDHFKYDSKIMARLTLEHKHALPEVDLAHTKQSVNADLLIRVPSVIRFADGRHIDAGATLLLLSRKIYKGLMGFLRPISLVHTEGSVSVLRSIA